MILMDFNSMYQGTITAGQGPEKYLFMERVFISEVASASSLDIKISRVVCYEILHNLFHC